MENKQINPERVIQLWDDHSQGLQSGNNRWNWVAEQISKEFSLDFFTGENARRMYRYHKHEAKGIAGTIAQTRPIVSAPPVKSQGDPFAELVKRTGIDVSRYRVKRGKVWGTPASPMVSFSFQERIAPTTDEFSGLIESLGNYAPPAPQRHPSVKGKHVALFSLYDAHIGKRGVNGETTASLVREYETAVTELAAKAQLFDLCEIVYVVGQDDLHFDNPMQSTTRLTPQDSDVSWRTAIDILCELHAKTILQLRDIAPVKVIVVPGNHNEFAAYLMGMFLDGYFRNDVSVTVDNTHSLRKYYQFGRSAFMFHHGQKNSKNMGAIFAIEAPLLFGTSQNLEIWQGHLHHRDTKVQTLTEQVGVLIRIMPSLSHTDQWHEDNLYSYSNRTAVCTIYHLEEMQVAEFYYNVVTEGV